MSKNVLSLPGLEPVSEFAKKLVETVGSAVGAIYEPARIRRRAKAEADAAKIAAQATVDAAKIRLGGALDLQEMASRASARIDNREMRRQRNIESIVRRAALQRPDTVAPDEVDEDWIAQFFNYCQDVSNEEMQVVWARLLAGEVAKPGSYSFRALHVVRTLRQADAALFRRVCNYLWRGDDSRFHFYTPETDALLKRRGIYYAHFLHLEFLGLMSLQPFLGLSLAPGAALQVEYSRKTHRLVNPGAGGKIRLKARPLTDVGNELARLCDSEPDDEYYALAIKVLTSCGVEVQLLEGGAPIAVYEPKSC